MRIKICIFLMVITSLTYWQVLDHGFMTYDDQEYVTSNVHVQAGLTSESIAWAFTTGYFANWHPVTWLSHIIDFEFFGLNPTGHHLVSLIIHIANTLLLFLVFMKMTGAIWQSALVAALFAIHPFNVESVAWVAERKNVLSTFFWMLTLWSYVRYVEKPSLARYTLTTLFLIVGLMAKPMLVTLPFVFLLLDFWPLRRWKLLSKDEESNGSQVKFSKLILEKFPFFIIVICSFIVTLYFLESGGVLKAVEEYSLYGRISSSLVSHVAYLQKTLWPADFSIFYPHPGDTLPVGKIIVSAVVLIAITIFVVRWIKRAPYLAVGWFWFLGTLAPVNGILFLGTHAMADRYAYVTTIGFYIMIAWGLTDLLSRWSLKEKIPVIFSGLLIPLTMVTWVQLGYWKDSVTLFEHAISVTNTKVSNATITYTNLGDALASEQRYEEAIFQYQIAEKIYPDFSSLHNSFGNALYELKRYDEAIEHFRRAIKTDASYSEAYNGLASAMGDKGKFKESIAFYKEAIRLKPDFAEAYQNLGITLEQIGQLEDSIRHYRKALEINPRLSLVHNNLATLLMNQNQDFEGALIHFRQAIDINPRYANAFSNLGSALAQKGEYIEAIGYFEKALAINPNHDKAEKYLELARSLVAKN